METFGVLRYHARRTTVVPGMIEATVAVLTPRVVFVLSAAGHGNVDFAHVALDSSPSSNLRVVCVNTCMLTSPTFYDLYLITGATHHQ